MKIAYPGGEEMVCYTFQFDGRQNLRFEESMRNRRKLKVPFLAVEACLQEAVKLCLQVLYRNHTDNAFYIFRQIF